MSRELRIAAVEPVVLGYRKNDPPMQRSFALVKVTADNGLTGWGEASTNWGHSYPTVLAAVVRDVCAGVLLGKDARDVQARTADLHVHLDGYLGRDGLTAQAVGALEIALWDLVGKALDAPVCELLGAVRRPIRLYGTGTTMFDETPAWHAQYFDTALAAGFGGVKVRLGRGIDDDGAVVAEVRRHVGPAVGIGVDSYWFHDARSALVLAERLVEHDVWFFEEPIPQHRTQPDPDRGRRARVLRRRVRPTRPGKGGLDLPARRVDLRRAARVPRRGCRGRAARHPRRAACRRANRHRAGGKPRLDDGRGS
jgi:L-alanine-DL-glutamate epimerase-like enolase superfamily enzyme